MPVEREEGKEGGERWGEKQGKEKGEERRDLGRNKRREGEKKKEEGEKMGKEREIAVPLLPSSKVTLHGFCWMQLALQTSPRGKWSVSHPCRTI